MGRNTDTLAESLQRRVEVVTAAKRGTNSILLLMDLEWDVIKAPVGAMCRCPNTFVHIVELT